MRASTYSAIAGSRKLRPSRAASAGSMLATTMPRLFLPGGTFSTVSRYHDCSDR
jgi:hypothetical protein